LDFLAADIAPIPAKDQGAAVDGGAWVAYLADAEPEGRRMSDVVIYHNPNCGTSRNVLQIIRDTGVEPTVVEYLKTGWDEALLTGLLARMEVRPSDILRGRNTPAEALGLTAPDVSDAAILKAMTAHPELVERPIVVTPKGAALCRPKERVLDLL